MILNDAGRAEIKNVRYKKAESCGYSIHKSSSGNVRILLADEDISSSGISDEQLTKWLDALDSIRETAAVWSADGLDTLDICAANDFRHYGLSGDPIYICRAYIPTELEKVAATIELPVEQQDILFPFVHEICHAADGFGHGGKADGIFDSELSAHLEAAYCLYVNGYRFDGKDTAKKHYKGSAKLENRVYSDEGFLYRLFEIFEDHGTELSEILPVFTERCDIAADSEGEMLKKFFDKLSEQVGYSVKDCFSETEISIIEMKFSDK